MRKELAILVLVISSTAILSASGRKDDDGQHLKRGRHHDKMMDSEKYCEFTEEEMMMEFFEDAETVSVNGTLTLINGERAAINSDGVKYYIMAPWEQLQKLDLVDGTEVSVEGYEMPYPPFQWDGNEKSIMVTTIVINGEETEIDHFDESCFRGMGHGMGRGRRGGPGQDGKGQSMRNDG